jgi:hypothetical protein
MKSMLVGIKNVLLWSYGRGTWQYDALCMAIVLTVFLVPSGYFGDRDRAKQKSANEIQSGGGRAPNAGETYVEAKAGETYVEAAELDGFLKRQNRVDLARTPEEAMRLYLRDRLERNVAINGWEHFTSSDGKVIYRVWYK